METVKLKLTDAILKAVDESVKRITDTEISGFHARFISKKVDDNRIAKFYLYYRIGGRGGKERNYLIGDTTSLTSSDARKQAKQLIGRIAAGEDVYLSRQSAAKKKAAERTLPTVNDLLDEFVELYVNKHRKRPEEVTRSFDKDVRPTLGKTLLQDLTKQLVVKKCLDPITRRKSPIQSNKTLSLLKQTFQFGVERGDLVFNPLDGTKRINIGGTEKPRDRYLSLDEIKQFFKWLDTSTASVQVKYCFKLLLLTGCRAEEMTLAEWSHIDWKNRVWLFPKENRKGKKDQTKDHIVPLTDTMIDCLDALKAAFGLLKSKYIFPSSTGDIGNKPIDRSACAKFLRRKFEGKKPTLKMPKFVPHDIRRSFQTHLASMGVEPVVVEKLLSHELQGMLRVYNQYDYMKERTLALQNWDDKIKELTNGLG